MTQEEIDKKYMQRCIQLARNGWQNAKPNPMVGAVVVSGGRIIGEGYHVRCGEGHAEVNCLAAVKPADESLLHESTLYVSLEPCSHVGRTPPCADLIIKKGVPRVVVGCIDPFDKVQGRGIRKLQEAGIEVVVGVLENECRELNKRFFIVHAAHRPYILLKWAQTADGFLDDHFKPIQISTAFTKMLTHKLRAENDAILVGRVTAERDHPRLDVREWSGRNPQRFMLSSETSIDEILEECCQKGLQSLLVEGGRKTLESFMECDLWDEIRVETGTMVVGAGTCAPRLPDHQKLVRLENYDGNEIVTYERKS